MVYQDFSNSIDLENIVKQNINLELISLKSNFYNELNDSNLVISPASVSSWEFINMGLPLAV
jgi:hypothetical protein